ncbi:putative mediator of RNA polymerase II transcription subunit 26 [Calliphora vicina]|uniref:putative mediator of RNA polymerase II transcription subunit 26 n=1 Tax=Calliphora vicina TaxID=7373 RepID=UPI00325BE450
MNFAIVALALLGVVAADVSHLNNMYLPPVLAGLAPKQHVSYAQETQEIPQASVHEVVGNSVVEEAAAAQEEAQKASGHLVVESVKFGGASFGGAVQGHAAAAVVQHVQTAAAVAHQVQAHAQEVVAAAVEAEAPAAPGSEVYQSTHQQAAYYTQVSQQQEQEQEQQQEVQEPEQKYYTGLVYNQGQEAVEQHQEQEVQAEVAAPQQTAFYGQQQQEFHHVEHHSGPQHSAVHVEHHVAVSAPVAQEFSQHQEQQADYFGQQSAGSSASSSSSSGVETQYAANGGYVY